MARRPIQARRLAGHLTDTAGVPVDVNFDQGQVWWIEWGNGPTTAQMRDLVAEALATGRFALMADRRLRYSRGETARAWAARAIAARRDGTWARVVPAGAAYHRGIAAPVIGRASDLTPEDFAGLRCVERLIEATPFPDRASAPEDEPLIAELLAAGNHSEYLMVRVLTGLDWTPTPSTETPVLQAVDEPELEADQAPATSDPTDDGSQRIGAVIAERFAAGWTPIDVEGRGAWQPAAVCGETAPRGEPELMTRDELVWFGARGWSFAISLPTNQIRVGIEMRGWRPARIGPKRIWRMVDAATGEVIRYAPPLTPEHLDVLAGGRDLTDDELEDLIEAHRHRSPAPPWPPAWGPTSCSSSASTDRLSTTDAFDRAGVPWLRSMLGGPDLDPRVEPIPWPPEHNQADSDIEPREDDR